MIVEFIRSPNFKRNLLRLLAVCVGLSVVSLLTIDQPIAQYSGDPANIQFWLFNREITEIGKSGWYFGFSATLWAVSFLLLKRKNLAAKARTELETWNKWGRAFFISLITAGIAVHIVKPFIGRLRPHRAPDFDPLMFDTFRFHWDWGSFPSGHSQTLFTVATLISLMLPRLTIWIFLLAAGFAMTRAFTVAHFTSDVIMGSYVGFAMAVITLRYLDKKQKINLDAYRRKPV